ncbi:MAG TPA: hypothetical protein VKS22_01130 [Candidatus Binataceae bacterium]|nr:hypothetical protein [Candidatus Binataceae bacterium]
MSTRLRRFDFNHWIITRASSADLRVGVLLMALISLSLAARPLHAASALFITGSLSISTLTQASANSEEEAEVPPEQVEKYIAVYRAMQHDRTLPIEQAASQQGMTLEAFRQLENRVQRDDGAMEHVRDALKESAEGPAPSATPTERKQ